MSRPAPFGPGLAHERTRLAWRRTLLALVVGSLLALRVLPPAVGTWSLGIGAAGLTASGVLGLLARRRARRQLVERPTPMPGAGLLTGLAAIVTALGAAATIALLAR